MQYELFFLIGEKREAQLDEIKTQVYQILETEGAKFADLEVIEKRRLAYEIKHEKRGTYVARRFELADVDYWADETNAQKEFGIAAITRKMNLFPSILRFIITRADELPELKQKEVRPEETRREKPSFKKETPREKKSAAPVAKPEVKAAPAEAAPVAEVVTETPAPAVVEVKETKPKATRKTKVEEKDIDKQLDELLNM